MAMFGGGFRGGIPFPQIDPYQAQGFGGGVPAGGAALPPVAASFEPRKRSFLDKLGLVADAFTGEQTNAAALARQDAQDLALWKAQQDQAADLAKIAAANKARAPHYWETNDGSLGVVGPDGTPQILYKDPTPKVDYTPVKNADGTTTLYPTINGQLVGGGARPAPAGPPPGVTFTPLPAQGGAGSGPRTFR